VATTHIEEVIKLADETGAVLWKVGGLLYRGCLFTSTGKASDAIQLLTSGISTWRSRGSKIFIPLFLAYLARAYAELGQYDDAWRTINEAMVSADTTKEQWCDAEICRIAGELTLMSESDTMKAESYFIRAISIAREQMAKSWELRAAISLAALWRDQGKRQQARDLIVSICEWFTQGFETHDFMEAKTLLHELAS
jgi:predicted ATPase